MELMLFEMLQQRAASAVNNALRHASSTRGIHDEKRVVERQLLEHKLGDDTIFIGVVGNPRFPSERHSGGLLRLAPPAQIRVPTYRARHSRS